MIDENNLTKAIENLNKSVDVLSSTLASSPHINEELKKDIQYLIRSMNNLTNDINKDR